MSIKLVLSAATLDSRGSGVGYIPLVHWPYMTSSMNVQFIDENKSIDCVWCGSLNTGSDKCINCGGPQNKERICNEQF
jgi:hypothetical protein